MADHGKLSAREGKQRVLTKARASVTSSISDALVMKSNRVFFLCQSDGSVPEEDGHGFGLYYDDTRYLGAYTFELAGHGLEMLAASDAEGDELHYFLINPDIKDENGELVPKETIAVSLHRAVDGDTNQLRDTFQFDHYGMEAVELPFSITLKPDFASVFDVRGMIGQKPGTLQAPDITQDCITHVYNGADGIVRKLCASFEPPPQQLDAHRIEFRLRLEPRATRTISVRLDVDELYRERPGARLVLEGEEASEDREAYLRNRTRVGTSSEDVQAVLDASFRDLRMLQTELDGQTYFAAGVPWFVTIFGRDTLTTALQTLAYNPLIAEQTLGLLAKYQGRQVDAWTEEEPGKILHELRQDELTNIGDIPYRPYYGTVDATVLFLLLLARHARWTGSLELFDRLRDNVTAALRWIDEYGDSDRDGYLDYDVRMKTGLINEGWKDSSDAMVTAAGDMATPPIAPAEVQGYVYAAKLEIADVFERDGDAETAERLRTEARDLKQRFNRDFWLPDEGVFAMALEKDMRPLAVVSSNAGQVLWTGIADEDKAAATADRLMRDDMFAGWGVRTLSTRAKRYSPISYHLGSVWPHDNSIILGGMRRAGRDDSSLRIFEAMVEAARTFPNERLPELFCGFERERYPKPVPYPVACHPQAWATGTVPYMLEQSLGLEPDGFSKRLRIRRPILPGFIPDIELQGLKVGDGECDLRFTRQDDGSGEVDVLRASGLEVETVDAP